MTATAPIRVVGVTDQQCSEAADTISHAAAMTGTAPTLLTGDNPAPHTTWRHKSA